MALELRTKDIIVVDMLNYVMARTDLTDDEVGSIVRSILEAAATEDDEQYFQIAQLLEAFKASTARGQNLDDRVAEADVERLQPAAATTTIVILDDLLTQDTLAFSVTAGSGGVQLEDSSEFPTSYPYTIRIGEGTSAVEDVTVSNNNTTNNVLTISTTSNNHAIGVRVAVVSGNPDRNLLPGIRVKTRTRRDTGTIIFVSTESGTLVNGNYNSTSISALAENPGKVDLAGGEIIEFASSAPFSGAGVTNITRASGGRDIESDDRLFERYRSQIQSLSRGTELTLKTQSIGITDPVTGQRVVTSNVLRRQAEEEVVVYVDDGTGFTPSSVAFPSASLASSVIIGASSVTLDDSDDFPDEGFILLSPEESSEIELLEYSGVNRTTHTFTLTGTTTTAHDSGDEVVLVDVIEDDSESGRNFFNFNKFPLVRNSVRVWIDNGSGFTQEVEDTDYLLNRGNGELEIIGSGLSSGAQVVATYTYYTGLIAQVQKVLLGDPEDEINYPGFASAGEHVVVETPTIRRITVRVAISAKPDFSENELIPLVREAIEVYVNSLGIGEDVIRAKIIEQAMSIEGVYNVSVTVPVGDIVILEDELPVPFDSSGDSLVTVT